MPLDRLAGQGRSKKEQYEYMTKASTISWRASSFRWYQIKYKKGYKKMSSDANKLVSSLFDVVLACKETEKGTRGAAGAAHRGPEKIKR
jgi:hypothetical protein